MRIVSLCPSITRLVFDLGAGANLVGITKYCIDPPERVAGIEKVGGTKDPKLARIMELAPDLVLLNQEENRREDWEALTEAGVPCNVTFPETVAGAIESVREIAGVLDRDGSRIIEGIKAAWARAKAERARFEGLRWAYLIWRKPWMAIGGKNYIHGLISEAGGTNVFADRDEIYPAIEADELARADPHLVILSSEPFPFKEKHRDELSEATGLDKDRFVTANGELLSWHGCYTDQGLDLAVQLLADTAARLVR